jgi:hypothetical protein
MQRLRLWLAMFLLVPALTSFSAHGALRLPTLTAGSTTYSNVSVSPSSGGRILVEYASGMVSVKIAELDLDTQQQLAEAGLLAPGAAKQIEKQVAKRDAAKKKTDDGATNSVPTMDEVERSSLARMLTSRRERHARNNHLDFDYN